MDHANWMSKLPEPLRQRPLSQIAIPGTHNSCTNDITRQSPEGPDLESIMKTLNNVTCDVSKRIVANWSITQNMNVTAQLNGGIRYLDLRLCYDANLKDYFFTHGLLSTSLIGVLGQIRDFLNSHPGEVVLMDFNHFYAMEYQQHVAATKLISQYLGNQLYPMPFNQPQNIPSIKECVDKKLRVLVFYHTTYSLNMPFWQGYTIPSPWPNTSDVTKMITYLQDKYVNGRHPSLFYVTQGIITPDSGMIFKNLFTSLRKITDKVNPAFINWVAAKKTGPQGVNICIADFCEDYEFVPTILALNR